MVQSNVMVTYAPMRRAAEPAQRDGVRSLVQKRAGITMAGALLAGGAVFALGQFVGPDGSLRETAFPSEPPLASAKRSTAPAAAPPLRETEPPEALSSPLPYLALVRDVAPAPPSAATNRSVPAAAERDADPRPRRVALRAASSASVPREQAAEAVRITPPPAPPPVAGQRRDLEGFLSEQGLAVAAPPPDAGGLAPMGEWTAEDLAAAGGPQAAPAPAASLAAESPVEPAAGRGDVLDLTESDALVETAAEVTQQPVAGVDTERLTAIAPSPAPLDRAPLPEPVALGTIQSAGIDPAAGAPRGVVAAELAVGAQQAELATVERVTGESPAMPVASATRDTSVIPREATSQLALAPAPLSRGASATPPPLAGYVQLFPMAVVNGEALGAVTVRDLGAQGQAVHLGALVGLLKLRMPEAEFARLSGAAAADRFVTLDQLRAAGLTVQFDARESRLLIDAR